MTIVDRAGVPTGVVAGVVWLEAEGRTAWPFVLACCLAGLLGDLGCHGLGRWLSRRPSSIPVSFRGPASWTDRALQMARFIDGAPIRWQVGGRAFSLVNQFVPIACGMRGRSWSEAAWTHSVGNGVWISCWATLAVVYGSISNGLETWARVLGAILGITFIALALRRLQITELVKAPGPDSGR